MSKAILLQGCHESSFTKVFASSLTNLTKFVANTLSPCNTMAQIQCKELGRQHLYPSLPILETLCPISAKYKTIAKYQWVITHTWSERRGILQLECNKFHVFIDRTMYLVYPSSSFFCALPASEGSLGCMCFAISTPLIHLAHLPIRLIKIKVY